MIEHSNAAKAHLVKALKALTRLQRLVQRHCSQSYRDLTHGEDIAQKLDKCPWWATYKGTDSSELRNSLISEQRHDLFISSTPVAGYLTGPTAAVAGYLTVSANILECTRLMLISRLLQPTMLLQCHRLLPWMTLTRRSLAGLWLVTLIFRKLKIPFEPKSNKRRRNER